MRMYELLQHHRNAFVQLVLNILINEAHSSKLQTIYMSSLSRPADSDTRHLSERDYVESDIYVLTIEAIRS